MNLLALDTATEHQSVALLLDGRRHTVEASEATGGSEQIMHLIEGLLAEAGAELQQLQAIAFGRGPGAFTGVRLAASICQGLAFAASLPVVPVSTLRAVAQRALTERPAVEGVLVCQDARMNEVYWGVFANREGIAMPVSGEMVGPPDSVVLAARRESGGWAGAGSGFAAYPQLTGTLGGALAEVVAGCYSRAREIAELALIEGLAASVPAEDALPVYIRNEVARIG